MVNPKADLRDWLRPRFDDTAISVPFDADTDLDIANRDVGPSWPSIEIAAKDSVVPGGGPMDMTGMDPGGGGAVQDQIYMIHVDCWGGPRDAQVYVDEDSDPVTVAAELGDALHDAAWATPENAPAGYNGAVAATPPQDAPHTDAAPTEHRTVVQVYLKATHTPTP